MRRLIVLLILLTIADSFLPGQLFPETLLARIRLYGGSALLVLSVLLLIAEWKKGFHPLYENTLLAVIGMGAAAYLLS